MSTTIKWGLIGASDVAATRVLPAIRRSGGEVDAVCSGSTDHAGAYAGAHGITHATSDVNDLLSRDIDAVYISSRNDQHAWQALTAAAAGKHILLEKPLAIDYTEARSVVAACAQAGVILAVNHHLPGAGTHRTIRELVRSGSIGRVLSASIRHAVMLPERLRGWRLSNRPGGGVILDITVHDASVLNPLIGHPAREVSALATTQGPWQAQAEDAAMVAIAYDGDILAQTHDAFTSAFTPTRLEVHGEDGSIVGLGVMTQDPVGQVFLTDAAGEREIDVSDRRDLYDIAIEGFVQAIRGDGPPAVTGEEGLAAYAVAQAALTSSRTGRAVSISELTK
jgi:1,5-anhydro-D-fructose reductase (1,5-anhydro-D-mannitol-forming)